MVTHLEGFCGYESSLFWIGDLETSSSSPCREGERRKTMQESSNPVSDQTAAVHTAEILHIHINLLRQRWRPRHCGTGRGRR